MSLMRDRYETLVAAGTASEGEVLRARDLIDDRTVALKLRSAESASEHLVREAQVLMAVPPHSNLPLVRDDFVEEGRHALVTDWVDGVDLGAKLERDGRPPLADTLGWIEQAASALEHLHSHGVVHGDVKPRNMILTTKGRVVLVDLGRDFDRSNSTHRSSGDGYVAPEVRAEREPGPAADVYGLAATAVTLLTGSPPGFAPPDLSGVPQQGRSAVEWALRVGLSADPAARHPSPRAFVEALLASAGSLPAGTVTYLFTDVEGSTRLWEAHPAEMVRAIARHDEIVGAAVARHNGALIRERGEGDSHFAVFSSPARGVGAAFEMQQRLSEEPWPDVTPIRVRMAMHSGEADLRDGSYYGVAVNRCARLRSLAKGGEVLLSRPLADLVADNLPEGAHLRDLGTRELKDLERVEHVFQLESGVAPRPNRGVAGTKRRLPRLAFAGGLLVVVVVAAAAGAASLLRPSDQLPLPPAATATTVTLPRGAEASTVPLRPSTAGLPIWRPAPGTTWQIQLEGDVDTEHKVDVYDVDLFDTPPSVVRRLQDRGVKVLCYVSVGTFEPWRPDADLFDDALKGNPVEDFAEERWLDVRNLSALRPVIDARLDLCAVGGYDGVDPDNVDGYQNDTGFPLRPEDQLAFNLYLSQAAHQRGLSIGLKNNIDQVAAVPQLVAAFDFAVNEECFTYKECSKLDGFRNAGKAVLHIEYDLPRSAFCAQSRTLGFSSVRKHKDIDSWAEPCWAG